jgi:broad specificity phosphatase PhoE
VLVRHGETVGQSSIRYYGATDVALSELGIRQMQRVGEALAGECFDVAYSSALQRTTLAARIIAPATPVQALPGFNEIHFGDWEGLTREEIAARDPQRYAVWRQNRHEFTYPGGDSVAAFRARVADTLRALLPHLPQRSLLIVHRGIIATVLMELLRLGPDEPATFPIDLASIHVVTRRDDASWHTEVANRVDHLDGLT